MLYRFREAQAAELGLAAPKKFERRPADSSRVDNVRDADKWRGQVIRDISRKISKIMDSKFMNMLCFSFYVLCFSSWFDCFDDRYLN